MTINLVATYLAPNWNLKKVIFTKNVYNKQKLQNPISPVRL